MAMKVIESVKRKFNNGMDSWFGSIFFHGGLGVFA